jgi:hypothetical protein
VGAGDERCFVADSGGGGLGDAHISVGDRGLRCGGTRAGLPFDDTKRRNRAAGVVPLAIGDHQSIVDVRYQMREPVGPRRF